MIKVYLLEYYWIFRIILVLIIVAERSSSSIISKEGLGSSSKVRRIKVLFELCKYNFLFICRLINLN